MTTWINREAACKMLNVGDTRLDQLRKAGRIEFKRGKAKRGKGEAWSLVSMEDCERYIGERESSVRRTTAAKMGKKNAKPQPTAPALVPHGDGWKLPEGSVLVMMEESGIRMVDSSKFIMI